MVKKTYKVNGMDCDACAKMIELDMEDLGVKALCSYPKQELKVEYDSEKISEEEIKEVIVNSRYNLSL